MHKLLQAEYKKSLSPITVFADSMMPVKKRMQDILPKKPVCDALISSYMGTCETLFRVIHTPTFLEQYNRYWDGTLTSDYYLPQLLAVLSIASRFETKSRGLGHERVEGVHIPTACALIRAWLNTLQGKQQIELPTLQAEILLVLTKRMIKAHTRDGWTQMGYVVRLAQAMGYIATLRNSSRPLILSMPRCAGDCGTPWRIWTFSSRRTATCQAPFAKEISPPGLPEFRRC